MQKLLKVLARAGLVASARGADGGYALARPAAEITAAQIVANTALLTRHIETAVRRDPSQWFWVHRRWRD